MVRLECLHAIVAVFKALEKSECEWNVETLALLR